MTVAITVHFENLRRLGLGPAVVNAAAERYVAAAALELRERMIDESPIGEEHVHPLSRKRKRGAAKMRGSMAVLRSSPRGIRSTAHVGTTTAHAKFVTWGTGPHRVDIRRKKSLTIWAPGGLPGDDGLWQAPDEYGFVHRLFVYIGSRAPNRWDQRAAESVAGKVDGLWSAAVARARADGLTPGGQAVMLDALSPALGFTFNDPEAR